MSNISKYAVDLFPPLLYKFQYPFKWETLENKVENYLSLAEKNSDLETGNAWSSVSIEENQPHTWPEFQKFLLYIDFVLLQIAEANKFITKKYQVNRSWINKHLKDGATLEHHHNQTTFVIVCYLKCPKNSGNIVFVDPLEYHKSNYPISTLTPEMGRDTEIQVSTNDVVIFPGWLKHYVTPSKSDDSRYIMSMDVLFVNF